MEWLYEILAVDAHSILVKWGDTKITVKDIHPLHGGLNKGKSEIFAIAPERDREHKVKWS
jgi:hypothetical protein